MPASSPGRYTPEKHFIGVSGRGEATNGLVGQRGADVEQAKAEIEQFTYVAVL